MVKWGELGTDNWGLYEEKSMESRVYIAVVLEPVNRFL